MIIKDAFLRVSSAITLGSSSGREGLGWVTTLSASEQVRIRGE